MGGGLYVSGIQSWADAQPRYSVQQTYKISAFLKRAKKMGADFIATGHYARLAERKSQKTKLFRFSKPKIKLKTKVIFCGRSVKSN